MIGINVPSQRLHNLVQPLNPERAKSNIPNSNDIDKISFFGGDIILNGLRELII